MNKLPHELAKLIDACRPGGGDLELPEMRPLVEALKSDPEVARTYERSQKLDGAISRAVKDAPEPRVDFEQRLLAQLEAANDLPVNETVESKSDAEVAPVCGGPELPEVALHPGQAGSVTRGASLRTMVRLAGFAAAVAASSLLVLWLTGRSPARITDQDLLPLAHDWRNQISETNWTTTDPVPRDFRPTGDVLGRIAGWQQMRLGRPPAKAFCYQITAPDNQPVLLFVFRDSNRFELGSAPPVAPISTQGLSVAAWRADGNVFVLVFTGRDRYQQIIRRPATA